MLQHLRVAQYQVTKEQANQISAGQPPAERVQAPLEAPPVGFDICLVYVDHPAAATAGQLSVRHVPGKQRALSSIHANLLRHLVDEEGLAGPQWSRDDQC